MFLCSAFATNTRRIRVFWSPGIET